MKARNSDVCLLYSESDRAIANNLEEALKYYSVDIWHPQNIGIGSQIFIETRKALAKAKFIIVLWSINSVQDAELIELASEAKKSNKVLIHVLIERAKVPTEFTGIKTADLVGWNGDKKNDQIVQLWKIFQNEVLISEKKKFKHFQFNTLLAVLGIIGTFAGTIFTLANKESRCFFRLDNCSTNEVSSQENSKPSEINSLSPSKTASSSETFLSSPSLSPSPSILPSISLPSSSTLPIQNSSQKNSERDAQITVEDNKFRFDFKNCQRNRETVICNLLITNFANNNRTIGIRTGDWDDRSRSFASGVEYSPKLVQIGQSQGYVAETSLIPNIPVKASLSFQIPQDITQLTALQVIYWNYSPGQYAFEAKHGEVVFRNIGIVVSN